MAKKRSVNKSAEIRGYLDENPTAGPTEIVDALAKKGVEVTPSFVSNIKSKTKSGLGPRRQGRAPVSAGFTSVSALVGAKKLIDQMGGIDQAQQALDVLKRLR
jgi:hypothetical protein